MKELDYYLLKAQEESAEIIQEFSKTSIFGFDSIKPGDNVTNQERCHREINDFLAVIEVLNEKFAFDFKPSPEQIELKKRKMETYYKFVKASGVSDPE